MTKLRVLLAGVVLAAITVLAGCATDDSGRRLTLTEQWKKMRERQDADAAAFVATDLTDRGGQ